MTTDADTTDIDLARVRRERVTPGALAVACEHAAPGDYCWPTARGVCAPRVAAAAHGAAHAAAAEPLHGGAR